jgi:hypothetical protein
MKEEYDSKFLVRNFFLNGVASLEPMQNVVQLLKYGPNIFTPSEVIQENYEEIKIYQGEKGSKHTAMKEVTLNFLKVICGSDEYNLNVFRVFARNVITASFEGRNWQSALFLYGAPGTSKTVWAEMLKKLVPSNFVQEFSRNQNQFTPNQLENTRLLIVSDIIELTAKQVDVIKRILGRDTFTKEEKFLSEYGTISPFCQVLFISNFPPRSFPLFAKDQAILDKLIQVQFTADLQIPAHLQIPNMSRLLDVVCSDFFLLGNSLQSCCVTTLYSCSWFESIF